MDPSSPKDEETLPSCWIYSDYSPGLEFHDEKKTQRQNYKAIY